MFFLRISILVTLLAWACSQEVEEYKLTVKRGRGGGFYAAGTKVVIRANALRKDQQFGHWSTLKISSGAVPYIEDIYVPSTILTMPKGDCHVEADYFKDGLFEPGVERDVVDVNYKPEMKVLISPYEAPVEKTFDYWNVQEGKPFILNNKNLAITTISIPKERMKVKETWKDMQPLYKLTVTRGIGSGYYKSGSNITIEATHIPTGKAFRDWETLIGDPSVVKDKTSPNTEITMIETGIHLRASYENMYELIVTGGMGDGYYAEGDIVHITADEAPMVNTFIDGM